MKKSRPSTTKGRTTKKERPTRTAPTYKFVELNNKSRQGLHVYIKQPGKPGRHYKYQPLTPVDPYLRYYEDSSRKKKKGSLRAYVQNYTALLLGQKPLKRTPVTRQAEQLVRKAKQKPTLQEVIRRGVSQAVIVNAFTATRAQVHKAKKDLLEGLVTNPELLESVVSEENLSKMKERLEYQLRFKDEKGKVLASASVFNKTPQQVIDELKRALKKGEKVKITETPRIQRKLKHYGYENVDLKTDGNIDSAEVTIIFRKGR